MAELRATLERFQLRVNDNARVRALITGWDRTLVVRGTGPEDALAVRFEGGLVRDLRPAMADEKAEVILHAETRVLCDVFTGVANPAQEFLEGTLQVFASDRDQVKLDAIALILWD